MIPSCGQSLGIWPVLGLLLHKVVSIRDNSLFSLFFLLFVHMDGTSYFWLLGLINGHCLIDVLGSLFD